MTTIFYNVPALPGVPQMARSPQFPSALGPVVGIAALAAILWHSSQAVSVWGVFDAQGKPVIDADSFLAFDNRNEWAVSDFPIQGGDFADYNKVAIPYSVTLRMSKGGSEIDRRIFLNDLKKVGPSLGLLTVLTPEQSYTGLTVARYQITRQGKKGAYFFTDVDVFFRQIKSVTAQYTTTNVTTPNAQNTSAQPTGNFGAVNTQAPSVPTAKIVTTALAGGS